MLTLPQREFAGLFIILIILFLFLIPSFHTARADVRDGLRREDITYLKRSLEQFYNEHELYPLAASDDCLTTANPDSWDFIETLPHDVREFREHSYRYCVTSQDQHGATGYFLEAQLETRPQSGQFFDEDERRKFHYRILHENNQTFYRVCGGEEKQCES